MFSYICKGRERAGGEQRPMRGGSAPPDGGQAPAPIELLSPLPDLLATLGSGRGTRHLVVPFMPASEVSRLRGKPALGPFQWSPSVRHHSPSRRHPASACLNSTTSPWMRIGLLARVSGVGPWTLGSVPQGPSVSCWWSGADLQRHVTSLQSLSARHCSSGSRHQSLESHHRSPDHQ